MNWHPARSLITGAPVLLRRGTPRPNVIKLYPAWSTTPCFRLANGSDRDSELIEVEW